MSDHLNSSFREDQEKPAPGGNGERGEDLHTEEFHFLIDAVTEYAIFKLDSEGQVASWNAGAEQIKGYAEEEIVGRHFSVFYTGENVKAGVPEKALESAAQEGKWTSEGWRVKKDGTRFWAHVTMTALFRDDGALRGFVKVTRDMTERHAREKRLEEEKRKAEQQKKRAEEARHKAEQEKTLLRLMHVVATTANDASSLEETLKEAVKAVCESTGWPVGHVYRAIQVGEPHERETRFVPADIWHLTSASRFDRFRAVTRNTVFAVGDSLPGRVARSGAPVWIRDVTDDPNFARADSAGNAGLKHAFGVPVRRGDDIIAVLEFFSDDEVEPDDGVLEALESVGMQLSRVAEREAARQNLRKSEERYRYLFEEAQSAIAISTPDGEIIDVNPAAEEILGYSHEELMAMNAIELYEDPKEREEATSLLAREGAVRNLEIHARNKSGKELVLEISTTVRRNADGEVIAYQTFFRDITEWKKAREALEESETKFRALTEKALVGIGLLQQGVYKYANPTLARISGYTQEELIGQSVEMLIHPEDIADVQEKIQRREAGEMEDAHYEARIITKEGETRFVEIRGTRLIYQGKPAIIGMVSDITQRKHVRETLKESEAKFRALAEESPVGILLIQDGQLKYANEALGEMYGYGREELLGLSYVDTLVHPDDRSNVLGHIDRRLSGKVKSTQFRFRGLKKDGTSIHVDAYGARIEFQGRPAIIGMDVDVTRRLRLQREVLNMQEEERRRMGRELHDGVASQLTAIALMIDLLSRRVKSGVLNLEEIPGKLEDVQERVIESGKDARRLSHGLALAGFSGKDLPDALARLVQDIEGGHFEGGLEDFAEEDETTAAHLYRIAQEAVSNAQKYAKANRITLRLRDEDGSIILESEDDGCGFDLDQVNEGSLGLRTMRYRAELLGGTLTIDTSEGSGTCIRCRVPI